jgi:hypothetical protein
MKQWWKPCYVVRKDIREAEPEGVLWVQGPRQIQLGPHWQETVMSADGNKVLEIISLN